MEFKGTKDEWYALEFGSTVLIQAGPYYESPDILNQENFTKEEVEANAKIMIASKDLLKALQALKSQFNEMVMDEDVDLDDGDVVVLNQAQKAIEKALK